MDSRTSRRIRTIWFEYIVSLATRRAIHALLIKCTFKWRTHETYVSILFAIFIVIRFYIWNETVFFPSIVDEWHWQRRRCIQWHSKSVKFQTTRRRIHNVYSINKTILNTFRIRSNTNFSTNFSRPTEADCSMWFDTVHESPGLWCVYCSLFAVPHIFVNSCLFFPMNCLDQTNSLTAQWECIGRMHYCLLGALRDEC